MSGHSKWDREAVAAQFTPEERAQARRGIDAYVVGHRLAEQRRREGLTQAEVAERMGVTKGRVSQIERGDVATMELVGRYAAAIGWHVRTVLAKDSGEIIPLYDAV
ncbi:helix-turn-helix transcriptional regulator [Nonomuraea turkmeniaca]|uniref:Helix-turn-helix transcriptional regulator n=1 Tax=Nonomuraea turkmeniaca TaxID=103838 RepID=A0A5S4EYK2_9ACTN|nr:helix-turn-helix transcriptional regulator [Nonomuraea turkmeniaca]TMR08804.1 helix-turn-helix transcriptional regulator [Nonomuraea turkmeniaca]